MIKIPIEVKEDINNAFCEVSITETNLYVEALIMSRHNENLFYFILGYMACMNKGKK